MKYFELVAEIDGTKEVIFGSFVKSECIYEKEAEARELKASGYKKIQIVSRETGEKPDKEVDPDHIVSKKEWFQLHAPSFNFELNQDQLIQKAIDRKILKKFDDDQYFIIDDDYKKQ
jgi:hypothetical protein